MRAAHRTAWRAMSYMQALPGPTRHSGGGFNNEVTVNQPEMFLCRISTMPTVTL